MNEHLWRAVAVSERGGWDVRIVARTGAGTVARAWDRAGDRPLLNPGSGRDVLSLSLGWRYAATPCPDGLMVASPSRLRSSASHAQAGSRRLMRAKRISNWVALRHGRSPSRAATCLNELERSQPLRGAMSA
jgi:hypothetical protein